MGQYYTPVIYDEENGKINIVKAFSLQGEDFRKSNDYRIYNGVKLMEHSWFKNPACKAVAKFLFKNPHRLAWFGDYSDDEWYSKFVHWDGEVQKTNYTEEDYTEEEARFDLRGKYAVNYDLEEYFKFSDIPKNEGWQIFGLSLLTATSNGEGGGDYWGSDNNLCGTWAGCVVSVESDEPDGFERIYPNFNVNFQSNCNTYVAIE